MRLMMHCMSATGSLSAFSASVAQTGIGQARTVQTVRAMDGTAQTGQAQTGQSMGGGPVRAAPSPRTGETGASPRPLPRGSLLDLTV
jgi:hypothetical protein